MQQYVIELYIHCIVSAENIAKELKDAVKEWGLPTHRGFPPVVADNAANMNKAIALTESTLHVGCLAHTLNLAAQKALQIKRVSHVLAKIRRIVAFFHRSTVAAALLKSKAQLLGLSDLKLQIDVCTRWNSAYDMISRYLELQCAVTAALRSKDVATLKLKEKDLNTLSDEDINLAEDIVECLKPLKVLTTMLCSESSPTVSIIMPLMNSLIRNTLAPREGDGSVILEMKAAMSTNLQPRYTDQKDKLNLASVVDPRFKLLPYLSDEARFDVFSALTTEAAKFAVSVGTGVVVKTEPGLAVPGHMEIPPRDTPEPELPSLPQLPEDATLVPESSPPTSPSKSCSAKVSVLQDLLGDVFVCKVEPAKSPLELAQAQVTQYKSEPAIPLHQNPLVWWKAHCYRYPLVAKVARSLLCIPATSVPSERVFSTAGDIVTQQRASLKSKHVDMMIFLKKNLK